MPWIVRFHDAFEPEFDGFAETVQDAILVKARLLELEGPDCHGLMQTL